MTDALLLDYNGVIVDDEPLHCEAFLAVLGEEGIVLGRDAYSTAYLGLDDRACFRKALDDHGRPAPPGDVAHLMARKGAYYRALARRSLPIVPGVGAFVLAAAKRFRIAVVSGAVRSEVAVGLERAGIGGAVSVIVTSEDVPGSKPDPAGLRLALARLGEPGRGPWRAVVAEDSLPGLGAARALGAGCLMLTTSHPAAALAAADLVWTSFEGHHPVELDPLVRTVPA